MYKDIHMPASILFSNRLLIAHKINESIYKQSCFAFASYCNNDKKMQITAFVGTVLR